MALCKASECLQCWGAQTLLVHALGSTWELVGTGKSRRHLPHPALKGTAMHPSQGISDFSLQQAEIDTTKKNAIDANWPFLTAAPSLVSLLFIARSIDTLLVPWPFLWSVKPPFCLNKHTHGKDLTQRLLKLLEGHFHGH